MIAKSAHTLFIQQEPSEQARLLKILLSNWTFDRGSLSPPYSKPFDMFVQGNQNGDWRAVWDDFRNWLDLGLQPAKCHENGRASE